MKKLDEFGGFVSGDMYIVVDSETGSGKEYESKEEFLVYDAGMKIEGSVWDVYGELSEETAAWFEDRGYPPVTRIPAPLVKAMRRV